MSLSLSLSVLVDFHFCRFIKFPSPFSLHSLAAMNNFVLLYVWFYYGQQIAVQRVTAITGVDYMTPMLTERSVYWRLKIWLNLFLIEGKGNVIINNS